MKRILILALLGMLPAVLRAQVPDPLTNVQDSIWLSGHSTARTWTGMKTQKVWVRNEDRQHFEATRILRGQPGHYTWLRMWVQWADDNYVAPRAAGPSALQLIMRGLAGVAEARVQEINRLNAEPWPEDNTRPSPPGVGPPLMPGMPTKQCVYTYLNSVYVHTISSVGLCPLMWPGP